MLLRILNIRLLQLWRISKELGVFRVFVSGLIILIILLYLRNAFIYNQNLTILVCFFLTTIIHSLRKDKKIISSISIFPAFIYFVEYVAYFLPLLIIIAFSTNIIYLILSLTSIFLVVLLNFQCSKNIATISIFSRFVPKENFEWLAGLRVGGIFIFLFWILALFLSFLPYISLVILCVILLMLNSFYEFNEPLNILVINEYDAKQFLKTKLKQHIKFYLKLIAPVVVLYGIINYELWYVTICFCAVNIFCFSTIIINKYASYKPTKGISANIILSLLIAISNIILPLLIFTIPFGLISYKQAITNLNYYLDDFN
ncbi:MAG: hypothetical protein LBT27_10050 [Prevotellaceae bacterium]|jgi:hypothetical protein|nr:hypothetical protein [Prevotellaceae bacterium]